MTIEYTASHLEDKIAKVFASAIKLGQLQNTPEKAALIVAQSIAASLTNDNPVLPELIIAPTAHINDKAFFIEARAPGYWPVNDRTNIKSTINGPSLLAKIQAEISTDEVIKILAELSELTTKLTDAIDWNYGSIGNDPRCNFLLEKMEPLETRLKELDSLKYKEYTNRRAS